MASLQGAIVPLQTPLDRRGMLAWSLYIVRTSTIEPAPKHRFASGTVSKNRQLRSTEPGQSPGDAPGAVELHGMEVMLNRMEWDSGAEWR